MSNTSPPLSLHVLKHKHPHPIPECPNDKRILGDPRVVRLRTALERQANIKLDARASGHLRHAMPPIDHVHDALHIGFRVQRGVQRRVRDGRRELTVCEDV